LRSPIFINGRFLTQQKTGVQKYAYDILDILPELFSQVTILYPAKSTLSASLSSRVEAIPIGSRTGHLWEQLDLPQYLKKQGNPLLLNLCNTGPLWYRHHYTALHDVAFAVYPQWYSLPFRLYYNSIVSRAAKRAKGILTVSAFSRQEIHQYLGVESSRIFVVHNYEPKTDLHPNQNDVAPPVLLCLGSANPRKNIQHVIKGFIQAKVKAKLMIVGGAHGAFSQIPELKTLLPHPDVEMKGYMTDEALQMLFQRVSGLINLSFYEGFNLPILEAALRQIPVLASDIPVHREIYGPHIRYTDPKNTETISHSIQGFLNNLPDHTQLAHSAKALQEQYSREHTKSQLIRWMEQEGI
jgi:glycosyltransferase involved in cell wall biosynthesis